MKTHRIEKKANRTSCFREMVEDILGQMHSSPHTHTFIFVKMVQNDWRGFERRRYGENPLLDFGMITITFLEREVNNNNNHSKKAK